MENFTGIRNGERVARLEGAPRPPAAEGAHWGMGEARTDGGGSRDRTLQTIAVCLYDHLPTQNGSEPLSLNPQIDLNECLWYKRKRRKKDDRKKHQRLFGWQNVGCDHSWNDHHITGKHLHNKIYSQ